METILNNFVECLNNGVQSYITYLYVHELCGVFIALIFIGPLMYSACKFLNKLIKDCK